MRSWEPADAAGVASLLAGIWGAEPDVLPLFAVHGPAGDAAGAFARSVVAERDGAIVGVGTLRESWLHPARWRVGLQVGAPHRRGGIGSRLLARLTDEIPIGDRRPLQSATRADDGPGRAFLERHGFRPLMRTRLGLLDPASLSPHDWGAIDAATLTAEAAGYRIDAVGRGIDARADERLAALQAEVYRLGHAWNPPAPISAAVARDLFLGEDLLPGEMVVATYGGAPIGVASLRRGERSDERELGWVGVVEGHRARVDALVAALVGVCLRRAVAQGRKVRVEVDEADAPTWWLVGGLPVAFEPDWLTVGRPAVGAAPTDSPRGARIGPG